MNEIIFLSFIAAIICLDVTAFGQFMISRPIVCGPLFGYLLGDIKAGLWIGMIVELIWIGAIPMGAAIPTDTTAVTILTVAWGLLALPGHKSALILAACLAIPAGVIYRRFDIWVRYINVRLVHWVEQGIGSGKESRLSHAVYYGMLFFFLKALIFFVVMIPVGKIVLVILYSQLPGKVVLGLEKAWDILPIAGFGLVFLTFRQNKFPCLK